MHPHGARSLPPRRFAIARAFAPRAFAPRAVAACALAACALAACGSSAHGPAAPTPGVGLDARFALAGLDERALCDRLLARGRDAYAVAVDPEPRVRRTVVVSDLHLGPGDGAADPRMTGLEDFYAGPAWATFLADQAARGPTDLVIDGDFIDFWQVEAARGDLPRTDDPGRDHDAPVLAADQAASLAALAPVLAAHADVFAALGRFLDGGDHRVVVLAGNHDADLLWPRVQLAIARAIAPADPSRLVFVDAAAYEHAGVHIEHGHGYDAANRFERGHAPFGRDRDGRCRLQSSWGEIFVDRWYTETERQVPYIDNLYPMSAAILWTMRDEPDSGRDLDAVVRFLDLLRVGEPARLNRHAIGALIESVVGDPGQDGTGPSSVDDVIDHIADRLTRGDTGAIAIARSILAMRTDPQLRGLWQPVVGAAAALPDLRAALAALRGFDPGALAHLRDLALGDSNDTAAGHILDDHPDVDVVVFGHTHEVGGAVHRVRGRRRDGTYANSGSWISVASVADLRARGLRLSQLSLADASMFPSRTTAVIIEPDRRVTVWNAGDPR